MESKQTPGPFRVSARWIDYAHGPGADDRQPLALELCDLPVKGGQVEIPADRLDLVKEIMSVANCYFGGMPGDNDPGAKRVYNRARAFLATLDGGK